MGDRFEECCVHESSRLIDAMRALDRAGLEIALLVDDVGRLVGTLTDGDVRRALLGGATLEARADGFAQRRCVTVGPKTGRVEVIELMRSRRIGQIPIVTDDGYLAGIHLLHEMIGAVERPNWAVIMAGGMGTRLRPITEKLPKPMIRVAGRPILERIVLHLVGFGIRRIFLAVHYMPDVIERHFGDGSSFGCHIDYLREAQPLGTGGALSLLPEPPKDVLLTLNGDLLTQVDVGRFLEYHATEGCTMTVGIHEYTHAIPFGVIESDAGRVTSILEKPVMAWQTSGGVYALSPDLVDRIPHDTPFQMPALIEECLRAGEPVGAYPLEGDWIDIGRRRELDRARGE